MKKGGLWIIGSTLLISIIGYIAFSVHKVLRNMADYTQVPGRIKICDLTNAITQVSFTFPEADHLHLLLGISNEVPYFQTGAINLFKEDALVRRYEFGTNDIQKSNWLDDYGLTGYILNWGVSNNSPKLDLYLTPNQTNRVVLEFDQLPATNVSLWLSYLQFWKDSQAEKKAE